MLYVTSLVLFYLIIGGLYLLTAFIQVPLPATPVSGRHKADLFSMSLFVPRYIT